MARKPEHLTPEEGDALRELTAALRRDVTDSVRVILFGSKARGDFDAESDLDLAIIVRGLTRDLKNRILKQVAEVELK